MNSRLAPSYACSAVAPLLLFCCCSYAAPLRQPCCCSAAALLHCCCAAKGSLRDAVAYLFPLLQQQRVLLLLLLSVLARVYCLCCCGVAAGLLQLLLSERGLLMEAFVSLVSATGIYALQQQHTLPLVEPFAAALRGLLEEVEQQKQLLIAAAAIRV